MQGNVSSAGDAVYGDVTDSFEAPSMLTRATYLSCLFVSFLL